MKIWILANHRSFETYANQRFVEVGKEMGIDVELVSPTEFEIIVTKEPQRSILRQGEPVELPDALIPRGTSLDVYFRLAVVRHLEKSGVLVLNSGDSISIARDKLATLQNLAAHNLPVPKTMLTKWSFDMETVEREFGYPIVLKTTAGSQGKEVLLCETQEQLESALNILHRSKDYNVNIILQEFISPSRGRDLRIFVLGGRAIGAMLRRAPEGKFKANYSAGGSVENFELTPEIEWLAVEAARFINLEIAGVDILFDDGGYKICEVNSSPGFEGFEEATGINVPAEIYKFIQLRLQS